MKGQFPLFHSPIDLAHHFWKLLIQPNDCAIDATCGNGQDTLFLAQICKRVLSLDIQKEALEKAKKRLDDLLPINNVTLLEMNHETLPDVDFPIRLIVYNLGYLPGGNKSLTTLEKSTLISVDLAINLVDFGGMVSITCYPGHPEGAREEKALVSLVADLDPKSFNVSYHRFESRKNAPSLILIQKKYC